MPHQYKVGQRVGAVMSAEGDTVYLLGYGTYEGDQIPPAELNVQFFGMSLDRPNPCIKLDNGKLVFGCECWWGPEDVIKSKLVQYHNIIDTDIVAEREKFNKKVSNNA
jgi:hypothetical protein